MKIITLLLGPEMLCDTRGCSLVVELSTSLYKVLNLIPGGEKKNCKHLNFWQLRNIPTENLYKIVILWIVFVLVVLIDI